MSDLGHEGLLRRRHPSLLTEGETARFRTLLARVRNGFGEDDLVEAIEALVERGRPEAMASDPLASIADLTRMVSERDEEIVRLREIAAKWRAMLEAAGVRAEDENSP